MYIKKIDSLLTGFLTTTFLVFISVVVIANIFFVGNQASAEATIVDLSGSGENCIEVCDEQGSAVDDDHPLSEDVVTINYRFDESFEPTVKINHLQLALDLSYLLESRNGKDLIGDNGQSIGPLQIKRVTIDDVNRILGYRAFTYSDRWDLGKSVDIFYVYSNHYGNYYQKKTGNSPTVETYLRMWNKGPNGWNKPDSLFHWKKAREKIPLYLRVFPDRYF